MLQTRVLVTHGLHWLPLCDTVLVLSAGEITELGSYEELLSHNGALAQFIKQYLLSSAEEEDVEEIAPEGNHQAWTLFLKSVYTLFTMPIIGLQC